MKFLLKVLPALAAGALLVAGCGESDSASDSRSGATGNPVDRAFVADMIPHHESAVEMAQIAQKRGTSEFVKKLADDIIKTQNTEISTMRAADQRLSAAGVEKGSLDLPKHKMGMGGDSDSLKTAKPFDRAFIKMMLAHHEGAVTMAEAEIAKGKDPELKKLAENIVTTQQREMKQMREHLGMKRSAGADDSMDGADDSMDGGAMDDGASDSGG